MTGFGDADASGAGGTGGMGVLGQRGGVLVIGLGVSGAAVAEALCARGDNVLVVDERGGPAVDERAERLRAAGVMTVVAGSGEGVAETGSGGEAARAAGLLAGRDAVVASPGVPQDHALVREAERQGVPVLSEPEVAWRLNGGRTRLAGVTGTNGKTTTTELLARCLDAPAIGNIGTPMVDVLGGSSAPPLAVAELSSFQLRFTVTLRTDVGVLLNVAPDHLDWHGSLAAYRAAKARVWANQRAEDWAVVNADDDGARTTVDEHAPPGRLVWFTLDEPRDGEVGVANGRLVQRVRADAPEVVAELGDLTLRGPHNIGNACAAVAAALVAGGDPAHVANTVRAFSPGPHRMELVARAHGVEWVNDSKATNPHAAAAALSAYPSVVWIAGGLNKGLAFDDLGPLLAERVRAAITIGASGPDIAAVARAAGVTVIEAGTIEEAVRHAADVARPGDTVLLSPACASMDQFRDYAERGERFRALAAAAAQAWEVTS